MWEENYGWDSCSCHFQLCYCHFMFTALILFRLDLQGKRNFMWRGFGGCWFLKTCNHEWNCLISCILVHMNDFHKFWIISRIISYHSVGWFDKFLYLLWQIERSFCVGGLLDRVDSYMFTGALAYSFVKTAIPLFGVWISKWPNTNGNLKMVNCTDFSW